jgi:hypothetical protein
MTPHRRLLAVVAAVLFVIYGLAGFGSITVKHSGGFLGFGLAALAVTLI